MKYTDLKFGDYVKVYSSNRITKDYFIHRFENMSDSEKGNGYYISNMTGDSSKFQFERSTPWFKDRLIVLPSHKEIKWLDECIKHDRFIPYNKVKFEIEYEIY